jgi:DNA-binding IclR family transcriptional regulator
MPIPKSCRKIEVLKAADDILEVIAGSREPIGISEIAKATNLTNDSVFRQIGTMAELRWVEKVGDGYALGMRIAVMRAKKKATLEAQRDLIDRQLEEIDGGEK